jgi:hypothetical protein
MTDSVKQLDGYMLDTTEFNAVVKGELPLSAISGQRLFATHVQLAEIDKTPCELTRAQLRAVFEEIPAENLPTESAVWDVTSWDQAKWPAGDGLFEAMLARLKALDKKGGKRHRSQTCDILIAETAIRNGLTLVSGDRNLGTITSEFEGRAFNREQFMLETRQAVEGSGNISRQIVR